MTCSATAIIGTVDPRRVEEVKERYRRYAPSYDSSPHLSGRLRSLAVARLDLKPGETVLDLGCGTGLSFSLLEGSVGPQGRIIGLDLSPHMLARAREKVEGGGWANVTLIEGNAEEVDLPRPLDAALAFFTPELTASHSVMERITKSLRPGGRIVAAGAKRAEGLRGFPINLYYLVENRAWRFVGVRGALKRLWAEQPYTYLDQLIGPLERRDYLGGCLYIAYGQKGNALPEIKG